MNEEIERPLPTREQIAEVIALNLDGVGDFRLWSEDYQNEMLEAADGVLSLLRGERV